MPLKLSELPSNEEMIRNIISTYSQANERDFTNGASWYATTKEYCKLIGQAFGYPVQNVVGAYAVLSPTNKKEKNDLDAYLAALWHSTGFPVHLWNSLGTYGRPNRIKAGRCLDGDLSAVGGKKVTAFYRNIMGMDVDVPTVDRWAARIACNRPFAQEQEILVTQKNVYDKIASAYISAAKKVGHSPMVTQSITWEVFRRLYFQKTGWMMSGDDEYEKLRKEVGLQ